MERYAEEAKKLIREQLTQGADPRGLALSCAVAVALGTVPLLGTTTLLCLIFGSLFKVNQPITQFLNYLLYPVQIILLPIFLRTGEWVLGVPPIQIHPLEFAAQLSASPRAFFAQYWAAGLHALLAWAIIAPFMGAAVFFLVRPALQRFRLEHDQIKKRIHRLFFTAGKFAYRFS